MLRFREVMADFYQRKGDERKETHYLLDGGKLVVPIDQEAEFLRRYAAFIHQGGRAFVVSRRSYPVFCMFFDFDVHVTDIQPAEWFEAIAKYVLSAVKEMMEASEDLYLLLCATDVKRTTKAGVECVKHGIHIHIPLLHVTKATAQVLRTAVVQKLANNLGERACPAGPTTWAEDVDAAVFEGNGLRILFSRKLITCPTCKNRSRDGCGTCLGEGRTDEGRAYTPLIKIDENFRTHALTGACALEMLRETSIRSARTTESHAQRSTPPCWLEMPDLLVAPAKKSRRAAKSFNDVGHLQEGVADVESSLRDKADLTEEQLSSIRKWIAKEVRNGRLPKAYSGVDVKGFTFSVFGSRCMAFVRLASSYCANIGREHATNTVYLEFDGRSQLCYCKCFCRCDTVEGRLSRNSAGRPVRCKEYRSTPNSAAELQTVLFPGSVTAINYLAQPNLFAMM